MADKQADFDALQAELAKLREQNAALHTVIEAQSRGGTLGCKVGDKGGVSVTGMGQFPVTLYVEQWERLIGAAGDPSSTGFIPTLKAFIEANRSRLKTKAQSKIAAAS